MMRREEALEYEQSQLKIELQRQETGYTTSPCRPPRGLHRLIGEIRAELEALDDRIPPLARASSELQNPQWGLLLRTGNDKSHPARQLERYSDISTSRVSNFLYQTPFVYLRSPRGSLPHDPLPR
jgi:hypothetical protein